MKAPETHFAQVGDSRVAYQVVGDGPIDLLYSSGTFSHCDLRWDHASHAGLFERLSSFSRLILFDRRGTGVSDPHPSEDAPTWEAGLEDMLAVMDAVGSRSAAVSVMADATPMGLLFAATYPERTSALILGSGTARYLEDEDYPEGLPRADAEAILAGLMEIWGTEDYIRSVLTSRANDPSFLAYYPKYLRACASPAQVHRYFSQALDLDVRSAVELVRCPTLSIAWSDMTLVPWEQSKWIADRIQGARFEMVEGDLGKYLEEPYGTALLTEEFLTGSRQALPADRVLASVLFTDIVASTDRAVQVGDHAWRSLLDRHDDVVSFAVDRFGGRVVKGTGDGSLAVFDGPAKAVRCALAVRDSVKGLGIQIRGGVHAGEIELRGDDVGGIAVHIASRVMSASEPDVITVSRTVKDLVMGSDLVFDPRGTHELKGIPGEWELYAAAHAT